MFIMSGTCKCYGIEPGAGHNVFVRPVSFLQTIPNGPAVRTYVSRNVASLRKLVRCVVSTGKNPVLYVSRNVSAERK